VRKRQTCRSKLNPLHVSTTGSTCSAKVSDLGIRAGTLLLLPGLQPRAFARGPGACGGAHHSLERDPAQEAIRDRLAVKHGGAPTLVLGDDTSRPRRALGPLNDQLCCLGSLHGGDRRNPPDDPAVSHSPSNAWRCERRQARGVRKSRRNPAISSWDVGSLPPLPARQDRSGRTHVPSPFHQKVPERNRTGQTSGSKSSKKRILVRGPDQSHLRAPWRDVRLRSSTAGDAATDLRAQRSGIPDVWNAAIVQSRQLHLGRPPLACGAYAQCSTARIAVAWG